MGLLSVSPCVTFARFFHSIMLNTVRLAQGMAHQHRHQQRRRHSHTCTHMYTRAQKQLRFPSYKTKNFPACLITSLHYGAICFSQTVTSNIVSFGFSLPQTYSRSNAICYMRILVKKNPLITAITLSCLTSIHYAHGIAQLDNKLR